LPCAVAASSRPALKVFNMGIDEQKEEREVLDSIFPDEITGAEPP
jgi:hypothetical protein